MCLERGQSVTYSKVSDLTLAIVSPTKIVVGELMICHETNLIKSRDYKLQKYQNLDAAKSNEFSRRTVLVNTIEVSTLGFGVAEPDFSSAEGSPLLISS